MDWRKFLTEPSTLLGVFTSACIGMIVGITQGVIQRKYGGWEGFASAILTAIVVSVLVGLTLQDYVRQETVRLALIGASAVIADDIWAGLRTIGKLVREDPLGVVARFLNALRGRGADSNSKRDTEV